MTPQEKIIKFMEMKRDVSLPIYFNDEDADEIRDWLPGESQGVWDSIAEFIHPDHPVFTGGSCPFCICSEINAGEILCEDCGYGKRHGICDENGSDYGKVRATTKGDTQPIIDFVEANR